MRTRISTPMGLAAAIALMGATAVTAQEEQQEPASDQITVQLSPVGESTVVGTVVVRFTEGEASEAVDIRYDVSGLESDATYGVVIHQGTCAEGTTTIAELGSVQSDADGRIRQSLPVDDEQAIALLIGERDRSAVAEEEQEISNEGMRHLQLQRDGKPVACGSFEPGA